MEIRQTREKDRASLFLLWEEAFGDSENTVKEFFDAFDFINNGFTVFKDGRAVSALYFIKAGIVYGGKTYPAAYIYAAATLKEYRGRGYMSKLIDFACKKAGEQGCACAFLCPSDKGLFDYYGKLGFKTAFYQREYERVNGRETGSFPFVSWDDKTVRFAAASEENVFLSGAVYNENGGEIYIDYFLTPNVFDTAGKMLKAFDGKEVYARFPVTDAEQAKTPRGMIKKLSDSVPDMDNIYLGISLE